MKEEWREIPGWEGFYAVSNLGRVKSLARTVPRPPSEMTVAERLLTIGHCSHGYPIVYFKRDGKRTHFRVHRLVLMAFVGPCPEGMEGCHDDGDRTNNRLDNLRWDTRSANALDTVRHGGHPMASKTHCTAGHPYIASNLYISNGRRTCRTCAIARAHNRRKKAAA